jgi:hypothetical protein
VTAAFPKADVDRQVPKWEVVRAESGPLEWWYTGLGLVPPAVTRGTQQSL